MVHQPFKAMAQCVTPYRLKTGEDVPCGRCSPCLKRRVNGWSFRLMEENKWASSAHFVTLTYDAAYVPINKAGFMTLKKRDVQLFFKRLRHIHTRYAKIASKIPVRKNGSGKAAAKTFNFKAAKIKYYICGEYGSKTNRPHYHAIIFNSTMDAITEAWALDGKPLGHCHIDEVNGATINYTLKYMAKPGRMPLFKGDIRVPEFSLMSKGLGLSYVNDAARKYHEVIEQKDGAYDLSKSKMFLVMPGGFKCAMPRYYKHKLFTHDFDRAVISYISGAKAREKEQKEMGDPVALRNAHEAIAASIRAFKKATGRDSI